MTAAKLVARLLEPGLASAGRPPCLLAEAAATGASRARAAPLAASGSLAALRATPVPSLAASRVAGAPVLLASAIGAVPAVGALVPAISAGFLTADVLALASTVPSQSEAAEALPRPSPSPFRAVTTVVRAPSRSAEVA